MSELIVSSMIKLQSTFFSRGDFSLYKLEREGEKYNWCSTNLFFSNKKDESYFSVSSGVDSEVMFGDEMLLEGQRLRFQSRSVDYENIGLQYLVKIMTELTRKPLVDVDGRQFRFGRVGYPRSSFVVETDRMERAAYFRIDEDNDEAYTFFMKPVEKVTESVLGKSWSRYPNRSDRSRLWLAFQNIVPWLEGSQLHSNSSHSSSP